MFKSIFNYVGPHKWNEAWGNYFANGKPIEYNDRVKYLEEQLQQCPDTFKNPPKYGVGPAFKELCPDYKRKKMFAKTPEV